MKINRNMSAVRANKQLLGTENRLSKSMKRLSSGYKINSAEDNPAGMAISNKMKAQIEALDQAKSNSSDAQNFHARMKKLCRDAAYLLFTLFIVTVGLFIF